MAGLKGEEGSGFGGRWGSGDNVGYLPRLMKGSVSVSNLSPLPQRRGKYPGYISWGHSVASPEYSPLLACQ